MIIKSDCQNIRLDLYLSNVTGYSRSLTKTMIEENKVLVNGKIMKSSYKVNIDDEIYYEEPEIKEIDVKAQDIPLDIVYEDDDLIVINKPVGMVVHPAPGNYEDTLVNAILSHCKGNLPTINSVIRPGIVHRIDKDTSGLLVIAKNDNSHNNLSQQFKVHSINREYVCVVCGHFKEMTGTIDAPIGRHPVDRKKMAVTAKNSKSAVTHFTVLEEFENYTMLKCKLETGRTHQIRVHMAYIGHSLLGDPVYGVKNKLGLKEQMLHAGLLGFVHPTTGEYVEFQVPPPEKFCEIVEKIRKGM